MRFFINSSSFPVVIASMTISIATMSSWTESITTGNASITTGAASITNCLAAKLALDLWIDNLNSENRKCKAFI